MFVVSLLAGVGFENGYLAGILFFGDGTHGQYTRLGTQGGFAHLCCISHILIKVLRPDFDFRQTHDAIG